MHDFEVGDRRCSRSLVVDTSKRNGAISTIAVFCNRTKEARLFETLYRRLRETDHTPFRDKSTDVRIDELPSSVVHDPYPGTVTACVHSTDDPKLGIAEATHTAILIDQIQPPTDDTVVVVDGDRSRAKRVARAAAGMDVPTPPLANCVRGEQYYPHLLVADMLAAVTAQSVHGRLSQPSAIDEVVETPCERWGRGFDAVVRDDQSRSLPELTQRQATSVSERIHCWFTGTFASSSGPPPQSDATTPVANTLDTMDCTAAAEWVRNQ